jgi:hypothetical protein
MRGAHAVGLTQQRQSQLGAHGRQHRQGREHGISMDILPQCFDMAIAQRVRHVLPYTDEHNILRAMGALEAEHVYAPSPVQSGLQRESIPAIVQE